MVVADSVTFLSGGFPMFTHNLCSWILAEGRSVRAHVRQATCSVEEQEPPVRTSDDQRSCRSSSPAAPVSP